MIFGDISNFNNVSDYLPILNGCLNADLFIILLSQHNFISSKYLKNWYKKFNLAAVIIDFLILVIGIIITRFFYKYFFQEFNIWKFIAIALCVQIIYDNLFYIFVKNIPLGYNYMLDFFKEYAKELGYKAIIGDSFAMIISCLLSSYFKTFTINTNIIGLVLSLYFIPYAINY
uniref:Uncharacterized protein n=1 Tax=viral metagenome TaxID=1070528 RepID=A0A6C0KMB1_9ZZZZ